MEFHTVIPVPGKRAIINQKRTIAISRLNQASSISAAAAQMMQMGKGDVIGFHQVKGTNDWYIAHTENGYKLRSSTGIGTLYFNAIDAARQIMDSANIQGDYIKFTIGREPVIDDEVSYWPIITSNPITPFKR